MIEEKNIREAAAVLKKYKAGKASLESRIINNEKWFKMRHWQDYRRDDGGKLPSSGWLFNSILNKHADAMDNYPEPAILPREQSDIEAANVLSQVIPAILERNKYEKIYSDTWWYKLKQGTGVKGIFWSPETEDIVIQKIDLLNLFWEPGITDIQQSKNLFNVELVDNDELQEEYPEINFTGSVVGFDVAKYVYDESVTPENKSIVVDWYYRKRNSKGETVLHYCKFVNDHILYASENDKKLAERGYYDHCLYPFVFDVMFQEEGQPIGFGYIDAMKDAQESIDELDSNIQFNARLLAKPRYMVKQGSGVNVQELIDYKKDTIETPGDPTSSVFQLPVQSLDSSVMTYRDIKINELKEISGNRDFNQGSTAGGVTAASAIAQLQEAGNKLSRDAIKSAYRAFAEEVEIIIELIRQFYTETQTFRITQPNGQYEFIDFDNQALQPKPGEEVMGVQLASYVPYFDIKISGQKKSPFNQISHNQFVMGLFEQGMFNPEIADQALTAISLMEFDGKDKVVKALQESIEAKANAMLPPEQPVEEPAGEVPEDMMPGEGIILDEQ